MLLSVFLFIAGIVSIKIAEGIQIYLCLVFKLEFKYKVNVMLKKIIVVLLMIFVLAGWGEDDLGGVAKVMGTLPAIGSQIDSEGVLVITFDDSSNVEKGIIIVTVHERGALENGPSLPLVDNQATIRSNSVGAMRLLIVSGQAKGYRLKQNGNMQYGAA